MSEASKAGELPKPLEPSETDPDLSAIEIAREVSLKDENSTAALLTAFKLSGFQIRSADGNFILGARNTGQGIGFESWEVASMAKL